MKLSLLVVTINHKKDSQTELPKDRPLPPKEGMNQKVPAKLHRNSSGTGRLNFTIMSVPRYLNNRGEGTRKQGWETGEEWKGRRNQMNMTPGGLRGSILKQKLL